MSKHASLTISLAALAAFAMAGAAGAAQCGNGPGGFEAWKREFAAEARQKGVSATAVSGPDGDELRDRDDRGRPRHAKLPPVAR